MQKHCERLILGMGRALRVLLETVLGGFGGLASRMITLPILLPFVPGKIFVNPKKMAVSELETFTLSTKA
jgi:hypothetical protein